MPCNNCRSKVTAPDPGQIGVRSFTPTTFPVLLPTNVTQGPAGALRPVRPVTDPRRQRELGMVPKQDRASTPPKTGTGFLPGQTPPPGMGPTNADVPQTPGTAIAGTIARGLDRLAQALAILFPKPREGNAA